MNVLAMLLQEQQPTPISGGAAAGIATGIMIVYLAILLLAIISMWKIFTKAGEPGWAAIVPIYNIIVLLKISGKPAWWFILLIIPFVNIIIAIMVCINLAQNFGKSTGFGVGLALLGFIFGPILAFGDARYQPVHVAA
jgi:hypothetical protein